MPTYQFKNVVTKQIEEHRMSFTELDNFKLNNPQLERYFSVESLPGFGDSMRMSTPGIGQPDSTFEKYVIGRIKETVPGNTLHKSHKTRTPREF